MTPKEIAEFINQDMLTQNLLYDLDLLPEQIKQDSPKWHKMTLIVIHMREQLKCGSSNAITKNSVIELVSSSNSAQERIPHHVDILLNYLMCENTETPNRQAMAWLEAHGYIYKGEPTSKAHNGRRRPVNSNKEGTA